MSAVPDELARARRDEIVNACAELYETMSFRDITLKEIGQRTSFTRTSIYNYFQTREEIFLALFQREYEDWTHDLLLLRCSHEAMTAEEFACALAETLARRERLLKLMSMNLYDMEDNSRMENLVAFKRTYAGAIHALAGCLENSSPGCPKMRCGGLSTRSCPSFSASIPIRRPRKNNAGPWSWPASAPRRSPSTR